MRTHRALGLTRRRYPSTSLHDEHWVPRHAKNQEPRAPEVTTKPWPCALPLFVFLGRHSGRSDEMRRVPLARHAVDIRAWVRGAGRDYLTSSGTKPPSVVRAALYDATLSR